MSARYLIVAASDEEQRTRFRARAVEQELVCAFDKAGLLVVATPDCAWLSVGDAGVVLGQIFTPRHEGALTDLAPETADAVATSRGGHLCELHWGSYVVALATSSGEAILMRAPLGDLPCLYARCDGAIVAASDVAMLGLFDLYRPRVDFDALTRHLIASDLRRNDTCLANLWELRGGQRLVIGPDSQTRLETEWTPWRFAAGPMQIEDQDECDRRLRNAVRYVVRTRGSALSPALLLLSGGLDSSIVAACLAEGGVSFSALTIFTSNPTGDERDYAKRAAARAGCILEERTSDLENIVIDRSPSTNLPRPVRRSFEQDTIAHAAHLAGLVGAAAILDGGGGDNVFGSLQSVAPLVDSLRTDGLFSGAFRRLARDISALTETSLLKVAWRALQRSRRASQNYRWSADLRLLAPRATGSVATALEHPWLDMPADVLPGRAAHLAVLIAAQGLVEDSDPQASVASCSILVAQPIVETCLRIPSRYWFERGNNRAVARRAFEPVLPPEIAWRRSKGTPDSFVVEIFEAHKPFIREMLLSGLLAERQVIDVDEARGILDDPRPTVGHDYTRIMQLFDAEMWARSWSAC